MEVNSNFIPHVADRVYKPDTDTLGNAATSPTARYGK